MKVITNDFSWSKSRHEKFQECLRAYYWHYYGSWGGWELESAPAVREAYVLKKLNNRFTWGGAVVHDTLKRALTRYRYGRDVDPAYEIERAYRMMRYDWKFSASREYWYTRQRKGFAGLAEHEYQVEVPAAEWKQNWENARAALTWFFASHWPDTARALKREQWLEVDEDDIEASAFMLEGVRAFAVPDLAYRDAGGTPVVVDWKTGKARDGYDDQVLGYALYLSARYGVPASSVRASLVYLNDGVEQTVRIDEAALEAFRQRVRLSVGAMRALLAGPDGNVPREVAAFAPTEDLTRCAWCVFRRPCGREGDRPTQRPPPRAGTQAELEFT